MLKFTRNETGQYVATGYVHQYTIYKTRTMTGEWQWNTDREDETKWSTNTKLVNAKKIAEMDDEFRHRVPVNKISAPPPPTDAEVTDAEVTEFMVRNARIRLGNQILDLREAVAEMEQAYENGNGMTMTSAARRVDVAAGGIVETAGIIRGLKKDF